MAGKPTKVMSTVTSYITNSLLGDGWQVTSARFSTSLSSSAYDRMEQMEYPLTVTTDYQDLNHSFLIIADIDIGLKHAMTPYKTVSNGTLDKLQPLVYEDRIKANATYSRSSDPDRTVFIQLGSSHQKSSLSVGGNVCFEQHIGASQGFVTHFREGRDSCSIPTIFCSTYDTCSPGIANASGIKSISSPAGYLLVRHPRSALGSGLEPLPWMDLR